MLNIQENIPLKNYTTFRIGGPAKFFVEVKNEEELMESVQYAKDNNLEFFVMGGGSNLLVSDQGFNGLVIKIKLTNYELQISENKIKADAGVALAKIVNDSAKNGLTGMEWAAGIPGTIGGAVRGNARAYGKNTGLAVESIRALDAVEAKIINLNNKECKFQYWGSIFKENPKLIILSVILALNLGDIDKIQKEIQETIKKRSTGHPKGVGSPGSFFLNPLTDSKKLRQDFLEDTGNVLTGDNIPAGWLIDKAGLRGKKIGGAKISDEHGNFIINTGDATAEDVIMLVSFIKQQVRDKFGVELQEEVQYVGF